MVEPSRPRVIILADGRTKDSHLEDRHLTRIGSKPLILRSVQQFSEWADVVVATNNDRIWDVLKAQKNTGRSRPTDQSDRYHGIDMIRKGLEIAYKSRSIIVFGDVYFSDEAVNTIKNHEADDWAVYGRSTDSAITGTPWAEWFAFEVNWRSRRWAREAVEMVASYYLSGEWHRASAWEWYYHMEKMPYHIANPKKVPTGPHWVEINDITDDIDFQRDIDNLQRAVADGI